MRREVIKFFGNASVKYFSTSIPRAATKSANIFSLKKPAFEALLDDYCEVLKKDEAKKVILESINSDLHNRVCYLNENEGTILALDLASKYKAFTSSLNLAIDGKFDKESQDQKILEIDLAGISLQLLTLSKDIHDLKSTKVLSSFICYNGAPIAFSSNAIRPTLGLKGYNIHHFALGELPERISAEENLLFGDELVMALVQYYLPSIVGADLKSHRISCQSCRSFKAQKKISLEVASSQEEIEEYSEPYRSDFDRIHKLSEKTLKEAIHCITQNRSDEKKPSIDSKIKLLPPAPRCDPEVKIVSSLSGEDRQGREVF